MAEFTFSTERSQAEAESTVEFLRTPRLWIPGEDYPDFDDWLERVTVELLDDRKRAMTAHFEKELVGTIIYQQHRDDPTTLEIRNISVAPNARGRYAGSFMLRNTELEGTGHDFPECERIVVDTKMANVGMIEFLLRHGYELETVTDLYGLGTGQDAVFTKPSPDTLTP